MSLEVIDSKNTKEINFDELVEKLNYLGYDIIIDYIDELKANIGVISGRGVYGFIGEYHNENHKLGDKYSNGKVTVFKEENFDVDGSKAQIQLGLPENIYEFNVLKKALSKIGENNIGDGKIISYEDELKYDIYGKLSYTLSKKGYELAQMKLLKKYNYTHIDDVLRKLTNEMYNVYKESGILPSIENILKQALK